MVRNDNARPLNVARREIITTGQLASFSAISGNALMIRL